MKIVIDTEQQTLTVSQEIHSLYSPESYEIISRESMKVGWSLGAYNSFSWMGMPILQLPEDMIRLQEVMWRLKPDILIETGVWGGGSLIYHASLMEAIGKGKVIGIEKFLQPGVREALESHRLGSRITLIEGDSTSIEISAQVRASVKPSDSIMVILDSDHSKAHVTKELNAYAQFVSPGSCLLIEDASMKDFAMVPNGHPSWEWDHPGTAVDEFIISHPEFERKLPELPMNKSRLKYSNSPTYWPDGWLWRKASDGH